MGAGAVEEVLAGFEMESICGTRGGTGFSGRLIAGASVWKGRTSGCSRGRTMAVAAREHCRVRETIVVQRWLGDVRRFCDSMRLSSNIEAPLQKTAMSSDQVRLCEKASVVELDTCGLGLVPVLLGDARTGNSKAQKQILRCAKDDKGIARHD
jgi:hypothetical protein